MKVIFIVSGIMLIIGIIANILAKFLEIRYKKKMNNISKNN